MKKIIIALLAMFSMSVNVNADSVNDTASVDMDMVMDIADTFLEQTDREKLDKLEALTNAYLEKKKQQKKFVKDCDLEKISSIQTECLADLDGIVQLVEEMEGEAEKTIDEIQRLSDEDSMEGHLLKAKVVVFKEFTRYITQKIINQR